MDKRFNGNLSRKIIFIEIGSLACFLGALLFQQMSTSSFKTSMILSDGMSICFSRLTQTYTAGLLKLGSSPYLADDFIKNTEDCFGQSTVSLEDSLSETFNESKESLNQFLSGVHWFHEKIKAGPSGLLDSKQFNSQLNSRYSKLESIKDNIVSSLDKNRTLYFYHERYSFAGVILFGGIFLFLGIVLTLSEMKRRKTLKRIESVASQECLKDDDLILDHVQQIVSDALLDLNLTSTRELFVRFYNDVLMGRAGSFVHKTYVENPVKQELITPKKSGLEINNSFTVPKSLYKDLGNIQLEEVLSTVIDSMAGHLFTRGVFLDLDIEDNLNILACKEGLEQIIFQLISFFSKEDESKGSKRITIRTKRENQVVKLQVISKNQVFNADFLDKANSPFLTDNTSLQIVKSLSDELEAQVEFLNQPSEVQGQMDGLIELVFKTGSSEKRLMGIKKGKKKDLIKDMSN